MTVSLLALLVLPAALLGATLLRAVSTEVMEVVLAFGLAALLFLVTEELLVEAHEEPETPLPNGRVLRRVSAISDFTNEWEKPMKAQESLGHLLKHSHGPHGGNLLRTPHEIIEVSIFEQAGLAYFRLHFYDHAGHPMPSPSVELINLKTVRQNGEEERFVLRPHDEALCLESMSAVRRPFTFAVNVTIQRTGPSQTCQVNFGEQQATNSQHNDEQPDS